MENFAKIIIFFGLATLIIGVIWLFLSKTGFNLSNLPGDMVIKRGNFTFYFPWVSMIVLSIVLSIILNFLIRK